MEYEELARLKTAQAVYDASLQMEPMRDKLRNEVTSEKMRERVLYPDFKILPPYGGINLDAIPLPGKNELRILGGNGYKLQ